MLEDETSAISDWRTGRWTRLGLAVLGVALWLAAATAIGVDTREARLFDALDRFDAGDRPSGFRGLDRLVGEHPDFRAARLIRESLIETENLEETLAALTPRPVVSLLEDPTDEAYSRLSYWFNRPPLGHLPDVLIEAVPGRSKVVIADTARSRLYLFDRSEAGWAMQGDWYTSIGRGGTAKRREGDLKTPLGVYFVTMWVAGRHLSELYGAGALGLNYPNGWDQRRRRDGFGIWIHGEPRGSRTTCRRSSGRKASWRCSIGVAISPSSAGRRSAATSSGQPSAPTAARSSSAPAGRGRPGRGKRSRPRP